MTLQGSRIAPCLWFDSEAEEAARFYTSIFPNSSIGPVLTYGKEGHEIHGRPEGSVLNAIRIASTLPPGRIGSIEVRPVRELQP